MVKEKDRDKNQIDMNDLHNGFLETKRGIDDKNINDKKTNDKDKNNIEDKNNHNELNKIKELEQQIEQLNKFVYSLQDDLAISLSKLIDEKLSKIKQQEMEKEIENKKLLEALKDSKRKSLENQVSIVRDNSGKYYEKYDSKTGENEKRSDYVFHADNSNTQQPDLVIQTKDDNGEEKRVIIETKIGTASKVTQNKLPIFDKKSGTSSFLGGVLGALVSGIPGAMLGAATVGKRIFNDESNENIDEEIHGFTREFLINNPVKSYSEFISRVIKINPNITIGTLETIKDCDDIGFLNEAILNIYEVVKNNERLKYDIPYIKVNFEDYKLTNNLRQIMKDRNLSQEQMSDLIKISRSSLINTLNNKGVTLENAWKLSITLGLPIEEIFNFSIPEEEIEENE